MCKKFLGFLLVGHFLYAAGSNIIEIMQNLQYDSNLIQQGFLLNKFDMVAEGIQRHKKNFSELQTFDIKLFLAKNDLHYVPVMDLFVTNIVEQRIALENFLKKNDKMRAFEAFQQLNLNCTKCHALIRKW